jgi:hypothetical protein
MLEKQLAAMEAERDEARAQRDSMQGSHDLRLAESDKFRRELLAAGAEVERLRGAASEALEALDIRCSHLAEAALRAALAPPPAQEPAPVPTTTAAPGDLLDALVAVHADLDAAGLSIDVDGMLREPAEDRAKAEAIACPIASIASEAPAASINGVPYFEAQAGTNAYIIASPIASDSAPDAKPTQSQEAPKEKRGRGPEVKTCWVVGCTEPGARMKDSRGRYCTAHAAIPVIDRQAINAQHLAEQRARQNAARKARKEAAP